MYSEYITSGPLILKRPRLRDQKVHLFIRLSVLVDSLSELMGNTNGFGDKKFGRRTGAALRLVLLIGPQEMTAQILKKEGG